MWVGFPILVFFGNGAWPSIRLHFLFCQHAHKSGSVCGFLSIRCAGSLPKKQHWWPIKISTFFPASAAALVATGFFLLLSSSAFRFLDLISPSLEKRRPTKWKCHFEKDPATNVRRFPELHSAFFIVSNFFCFVFWRMGKYDSFLRRRLGRSVRPRRRRRRCQNFYLKAIAFYFFLPGKPQIGGEGGGVTKSIYPKLIPPYLRKKGKFIHVVRGFFTGKRIVVKLKLEHPSPLPFPPLFLFRPCAALTSFSRVIERAPQQSR